MKFRSKHSIDTVLCLQRNLMHQTLHRHFLESQTVVNTSGPSEGLKIRKGGGG